MSQAKLLQFARFALAAIIAIAEFAEPPALAEDEYFEAVPAVQNGRDAVLVTNGVVYSPGATVQITGQGFEQGTLVTMQVVHANQPCRLNGHEPWTARVCAEGTIRAQWYIDPADSGGGEYVVAAAANDGTTVATNFAAPLTGAIWTTDQCGATVNQSVYGSCQPPDPRTCDPKSPFLNGGPQNTNCGAAGGLPDELCDGGDSGDYYFQVTNPGASVLLSSDAIEERRVRVSGGVITAYLGTTHVVGTAFCAGSISVALWPFASTDNSGGEYKVWMTPVCAYDPTDPQGNFGFRENASKTDNFKCSRCPAAGGGSGDGDCPCEELDSDSDRVNDCDDVCPGTPPETRVDAQGCPCVETDSDSDGVNDCDDECPDTPAAAATNPQGCSCGQVDCDDGDPCTLDSCEAGECSFATVDADSDGVGDCDDECPDTPAQTPVDPQGCPCVETDSDSDGVNDCDDECPGTPSQTPVDGSGCPCIERDIDSDGVNDCDDRCPDTPTQTQVDLRGCPCAAADTDSDGVNDCNDRCPETPSQTQVDPVGCPCEESDTDSDGVNDCDDRCPETPPKSAVDKEGCSCEQLDSDADGVHNCDDGCPDTPGKSPVNPMGCSCSEVICEDEDPCTLDSCEAGICSNVFLDADTDGVCDGEDSCPGFPDDADRDEDGVPDGCDNCEAVANADQEDRDGDGVGDVCTPPPVPGATDGACCFADATCGSAASEAMCVALGGTFHGIGSDCADVSCPCEQPDVVSLLFSMLSFAPVCGEGCLMAISLTLFGLWKGKNRRAIRRVSHK